MSFFKDKKYEVGEICESEIPSRAVSVEWKILDGVTAINEQCLLYSPGINFMGSIFFLEIIGNVTVDDPYDDDDLEEWLSFRLWLESKGNEYEGRMVFVIGIKKANDSKEYVAQGILEKDDIRTEDLGPLQMSDLVERKSELAPLDILTVTCTIWSDGLPSVNDGGSKALSNWAESGSLKSKNKKKKKKKKGRKASELGSSATASFDADDSSSLHSSGNVDAEVEKECSMAETRNVSRETQTDLPTNDSGEKERTHHEDEGTALLRKHFQDMLLEGPDRDVTLKVKDKVFRAHKDVLRARSPVFAAMFAHEMKAAECGAVTIEDCDPDAFGQLLEYVYTGRVDNLTPKNTLGLYYAADKYDFSSLKKTCVDYLKTSLSTNGVCDVIAMAVKHNEEGLRDCAMAFFTNHFHGILVTIEWQHFLKRDSSLANELLIKAMKSYKKDE